MKSNLFTRGGGEGGNMLGAWHSLQYVAVVLL